MRNHLLKKTICFTAVLLMMTIILPVQTLAAGGKEPPGLPYEKVIYQNGSWVTLWDSGKLFFGYEGTYEIDEGLFINDKTGANISRIPPAEFRINRDQVVSVLCLPYVYYPVSPERPAEILPVYVQLEDSRGNLYGPYLMEGMRQIAMSGSRTDFTAEEREEREAVDDEPGIIGAKPVRYMYTFRPEGELRLPRGRYTLHTSDPANLVRTKSSGLEGAVFIKGYEGSAYDKYKKELHLWNLKNNPELFENVTIIREVAGEEDIQGEAVTEEYTVLGNTALFEYREVRDEGKKEYPVHQSAENPPAQFPLYLSLPAPALIDEIVFNTYNGGLGAPPGTVTITGINDGEDYGTFQANGGTLQGTPNGMWIVSPGITLPAGEYMVDVSDEKVVASFGDGSPDFFIGATPPPPVNHDFSGTYLIDVTTQKTGSVGIGVQTGESKDTFSLSSHPVTILDRGDHILLIGSYEGITVSQRCAVSSRTLNSLQTTLEFSVDLSGTPAKTTIGSALNISLSKPEQGTGILTLGGSATYARETTEEKGGDYNTYQVTGSGVFAGQDLPPAVLPFMGLGMASAGSIPGPDGPGQAATGILFPPLATLLAGLLESLFRRKESLAQDELFTSNPGVLPPEVYDFGDGRQYQEGGTYTFDDGGEYIVRNGELELVRQLGEGDHYTNPDGDRKVWIGGQPWQTSDWEAQEATNRDYTQAHARDWENASRSPDQYMQETFDEITEQEELYGTLGRMQQAATRNDMATPGEIDDMYSRINKLMNDMDAGKPADYENIIRIRDYMGNRLAGNTASERDLPAPEQYGGWLNAGLLSEALAETGRNLSTVSTSDGGTSWRGLAGRIAIGAMTGGQSEWVFRPIGATYTMNDAIQNGASDLGAFGAGVARVGTEWVAANAVAGVMNTFGGAGGAAISHVTGGGGAHGLGSAIASGGKQGLSRWGAGMAAQVKDVASREAWSAAANRLTDTVTRGVTRMDDILRGKEGLRLPESWSGTPQAPISAPKQPLSALEQNRLSDFERAVRSGDPNQIAREYGNGGMKHLSELQQKGHISADTARKANELLTRKVNSAIRQGTDDALRRTQQQTGVRVKELIVGDSGSGAKKAVGRIMTDADRTLIPRFEEADLRNYMKVQKLIRPQAYDSIPRFNEADLRNYMKGHKLTRSQAYDSLCKQLQKNHISSVGDSLEKSGLSAKDVGFSSYDRIGSASGQADSYGSRFTNVRQAGAGTAEVYTPDGKGGFRVHSTSGHAAVDQSLLNKQTFGTGTIPADPVKLLPRDVPSIIKQQTGSVMKYPGDPLAAAKAIGRADKVSQIIKNNGILSKSMKDMNGKLVRMANDIYANPGSINTVLRRNGMTLEQFLKQSKDVLAGYDRTLSGVRIQ